MGNFVVVGGTSGIGLKTGSLISKEGHNLFALSRSAPDGKMLHI